jgi:hypothetical protein
VNLIRRGFPKMPKKWKGHLSFINFLMRNFTKELHHEKRPKKSFIIELCNLVNPVELDALTFEFDVQEVNFKVLQLLFKVYMFFLGNGKLFLLFQKLHSFAKKTQLRNFRDFFLNQMNGNPL